MRVLPSIVLSVCCLLHASPARAAGDDATATAFFESKIRPVLVEQCYNCHSGKTGKPKGGLRLDSREAVLKGGRTGPALVPGKPEESLILKALSHEGDVAEMPPDAKLPDPVLADFRRWIASGAADPRHGALPDRPSDAAARSGGEFWAFRPPARHAPAPPRPHLGPR
ncbi:MAG: c-type cytochrome domain-containing protein [Isosphaeraceae bacterium]